MSEALAGHYARALASAVFAPDSGLAPQYAVEQMRSADELIAGSKQLQEALLSPAIAKPRKRAVIGRLADELGLHRLIRNFLLVVIGHRRIKDFTAIRQHFEQEVDERTGWIRAEITSARELSAEQRQAIERVFGTKLGKFIRATYKVDPALIGGIRAHAGSREYDASVQGKLASMRQRVAAHRQ